MRKKELLELVSTRFDPGIASILQQAKDKVSPAKVMGQALDILGDIFEEALLLQKEVTLPGGIGKLVPRRREGHRKYIPATGKHVQIDPTITVKFVPSGRFSKKLKLKKGK